MDLRVAVTVLAGYRAAGARHAGVFAGGIGLSSVTQAFVQIELIVVQGMCRAAADAGFCYAAGTGRFRLYRHGGGQIGIGQHHRTVGEPGAESGINPDHERRRVMPARQFA